MNKQNQPEKLRVLLVSSRSDHGGGPSQALAIASGLASEFEFFAAMPSNGSYWQRFADTLGSERMLEIPERAVSLEALRSLRRFVSESHISIVHSHGKGAGVLTRTTGPLRGAARVHTFHGLHEEGYGPFRRKLYRLIESALGLQTDAIIAVSSDELLAAGERFRIKPGKLFLIRNGVEGSNLRAKFDRDPFQICSVTRANEQKNPAMLFDICSALFGLGLTPTFAVVCPEADIAHLQGECASHGLSKYFRFVGPQDSCAELFASSQAYLSTSAWEGLPLAPLEAMAAGLPVVLPNSQGHGDFETAGIAQDLYSYDHPDQAAVLVSELHDAAHWKRSSEINLEVADREFSSEWMCRQTSRLYHRVNGSNS